jgi:hypothetical protein
MYANKGAAFQILSKSVEELNSIYQNLLKILMNTLHQN